MKSGLSLRDLWQKKCPLCEFHDVHAFGCPAHVSKKRLLDGMSILRWERQSGQGMCVGMSNEHARSVPLASNFETGNIALQWNTVFDNWFPIVVTNMDDSPDFHAKEWSKCLEPARLTHNQMMKSKNLHKGDQLKQLDLTLKRKH